MDLFPSIGGMLGTALAIALFAVLGDAGVLRTAALMMVLALFASAAWRWALDHDARQRLRSLLQEARL